MLEILNEYKTAYLAPNGNFTHMAALLDQEQRGYPTEALYPCASIGEAFDALAKREVGYVVAPIENSTDGTVKDTLAALQNYALIIRRKLAVPIRHFGYSLPGYEVSEIRSKDTAINQCSRNLDRMYPNIKRTAVDSTGLSVRQASLEPGVLGIGSSIAAEAQGLAGLKVVPNLEDNPHNTTTFILATNQNLEMTPTGCDETSLIVSLSNEKASLLSLLDGIGENGINVSKIKSLSRDKGLVRMLLSLDGYYLREEVGGLMVRSSKKVEDVKYLGAYPKLIPPALPKGVEADMKFAVSKVKEAGATMDKPDQTFAVFTVPNRPKALAEALEVFQDIDLTAIDSLPSGIPDEHIFYLGFNNGIENKDRLVEDLDDRTLRLFLVEGNTFKYTRIS